QSITPTLGGSLQQSYSVGTALSHQINQLSSVSVAGSFSATNSSPQFSQFTSVTGGSSANFYSASVIYSYRLTRDWATSLSYSYLQRSENTGTVSANMFLFSLSY